MKKAKKTHPKTQMKPKVINKTVPINSQLDQWMNCNIGTLTENQLIEAANFLDKTIDEEQHEQVILQRARIICLLEAWMGKAKALPEWFLSFHAKQLVGSGIACDRIASASKNSNDSKAADYWANGALFLGRLLFEYPSQPEWVTQYHEKQLLEGGAACDRVASVSKGIDDIKAVEYWLKGAALLGQYLKDYPNVPEWVVSSHKKQLLEGSLACDRIASANKNSDDIKASDYWLNGSSLLGRLLSDYPDQPEWVVRSLEKQLLEGGAACDRVASAAKGTDDTKAAGSWIKGAALLGQYLKDYPNPPEWVVSSHKKQLLEGSLACDRIASTTKNSDDIKASDYWTKGALLLGQYLKFYGNEQEWIVWVHQKQLLEGGVACHRVATRKKQQNDVTATDVWAKGAALLDQLLAHYPEQPEWVAYYQDIAKSNASAISPLAQLIELERFDSVFSIKKKTVFR